MKGDFRLLVLVGIGVIAAGWAFTYAGPIQQLTTTGTSGWLTMVHGLEPPQIASAYGVAGGGGNFSSNTGTYGGAPAYATGPY